MSADSWDNFWKHSTKEQQMPCFGAQTDILKQTWLEIFQSKFSALGPSTVLDIACGDGTLISHFAEFLESDENWKLVASDYSQSACADVANRNRGIQSVCCNSSSMPFANESIDVIFSQYGIEYAGNKAFEEAFRCLKPKGIFAAVCHAFDGSIYKECLENGEATKAFLTSGIFEKGKVLFSVAGQVLSGDAPKDDFIEADKAFSISVGSCKALFESRSSDVCGGYLYKVYSELGQMFSKIQSYKTQDVLDWLDRTENEMQAYHSRMESMTSSALSKNALDNIFSQYQNHHLDVHCEWEVVPLHGKFHASKGQSDDVIGWVIIFSKK